MDRENTTLARRISELAGEDLRLLQDMMDLREREARFRRMIRAEEKAKAEQKFCFAARVSRGEGWALL